VLAVDPSGHIEWLLAVLAQIVDCHIAVIETDYGQERIRWMDVTAHDTTVGLN